MGVKRLANRAHKRHALSYILRMWQIDNGKRAVWRASLQDVHTGERRGFAGLDDAHRFLCAQTGDAIQAHPATDACHGSLDEGDLGPTTEAGKEDGIEH